MLEAKNPFRNDQKPFRKNASHPPPDPEMKVKIKSVWAEIFSQNEDKDVCLFKSV